VEITFVNWKSEDGGVSRHAFIKELPSELVEDDAARDKKAGEPGRRQKNVRRPPQRHQLKLLA
jgi:hypothetical protein